MVFALGYIAGVATCVFIAIVLVLLRKPLIQMAAPIITRIEAMAPGPKGFVMEPDSEAQIAREQHIKRNAEAGKDTRIDELL